MRVRPDAPWPCLRSSNVSTGDASAVIAAFAVAYGVLQTVLWPAGRPSGQNPRGAGGHVGVARFSAITALAPNSRRWWYRGRPWALRQRASSRCAWPGLATRCLRAAPGDPGRADGGHGVGDDGLPVVWRLCGGGAGLARGICGAGVPVCHGCHAAVAAGECVHARCWQRRSILCAGFIAAYLANTRQLLAMPRVRWVLTVVTIEGALAFGTLAFVPSRMVEGMACRQRPRAV